MSLLCKSMSVQIYRWILIPKLVGKKVFLMKAKHQYHLSQSGECAHGALSWKQRRLLYESVFIEITEER